MLPRLALGSAICLFGVCGAAFSQPYPSKPITLIVLVAPGGATSTTAFMIRDKLREQLKQPVVIDHKAGADGIIGTGLAAKASPDGYTLLLASMSHITINPSLYKTLSCDTLKDLAPVAMISTFPLFLVVHPSVPANSVKELIALARANPGRFNYGSSGQGNSNHLAAELLSTQAGINMVHVAYKGGSGVIVATMSNEVSIMFGTPQTAISQINAGKLKVLAVS